MKRIIGLAATVAVAVSAVLAFGAFAVSSASAALPEFLGLAGVKDIKFTGVSLLTVLRAKRAGVEGTVECHKDLVSGLILVPSMLVDNILLHFHTGCEQTLSGTKTKCTEPILTKLLMGEAGWTKQTAPLTPVGLLLKPESGTEFASVECGGNTTKVEGEIVVEIPETNPITLGNQYNKPLKEYVLVVKSSNANAQETPETFELLSGFPTPLFMTGVKLKVAGFFGEGASENGTELTTLSSDGELTT